jgi:hypothetical protein
LPRLPPGVERFRLEGSRRSTLVLPSDRFASQTPIAEYAPFREEDVRALAAVIGADRVRFGSDWPHSEGTAQPSAPAPSGRRFGVDRLDEV